MGRDSLSLYVDVWNGKRQTDLWVTLIDCSGILAALIDCSGILAALIDCSGLWVLWSMVNLVILSLIRCLSALFIIGFPHRCSGYSNDRLHVDGSLILIFGIKKHFGFY